MEVTVYSNTIEKLVNTIGPDVAVYVKITKDEECTKTTKKEQPVYKCCMCSEKSNRSFNIVRHYDRFHVSKTTEFGCSYCDEKFNIKSHKQVHETFCGKRTNKNNKKKLKSVIKKNQDENIPIMNKLETRTSYDDPTDTLHDELNAALYLVCPDEREQIERIKMAVLGLMKLCGNIEES
ncbi:uncharacterized protein LOC116845870 [Odontomachus brunneus]|uniref:uncharacterized protein LOC116845870 n=1 Tax=Odontomachus brunneus TaxID=486640 RepID=UPI0013F23889|nr:uncharacterized protein LOC116845870 [Odontomachus brunneus]